MKWCTVVPRIGEYEGVKAVNPVTFRQLFYDVLCKGGKSLHPSNKTEIFYFPELVRSDPKRILKKTAIFLWL